MESESTVFLPATQSRTPSADHRRTRMPEIKKLRRGLEALLYRQAGYYRRRSAILACWTREAERVLLRQQEFSGWRDSRLHEEIMRLQEASVRGRAGAADLRVDSLAAVAELSSRALGLTPYREQIAGAIGLNDGFLVEMATGEGKTLTIALAAVLAAWRALPCHIVTANDYLADRDAREMRRLYARCRVSVACVTGGMEPAERSQRYQSDVVYTTSKELVADFLRDRLQWDVLQNGHRRALRALLNPRVLSPPGIVQSGFETVLVDEADNILIDEAVTPLIISKPGENAMLAEATRDASRLAEQLVRGVHYTIDERYRHVELTDAGAARVRESLDATGAILKNPKWRKDLLLKALQAREFFLRGKHYIVRDGKVVIVDENTGRLMPDRTWRQGLHQAIEIKEGLEITAPSETMASVSFQRFFRQIPRLSGVTGTALENAPEFWSVYELPVIAVPTHRPCRRKVEGERLFVDEDQKYEAIVQEVERGLEAGRPVLIGTRNVSASERLAAMLHERNIPFELLNAVHHEREAKIIGLAGWVGQVTIATNMAGRGTDIRLQEGVADRGGLRVLATERHESHRIDRQLFGRCARQGDAGSVLIFGSMEDEIGRRFIPRVVRDLCACWLRSGLPGADHAARAMLAIAQRRATRHNYRQRLAVLRRDRWLDESLSFSSGVRLGRDG